jgi:Protein of unknown function (DUF1329)
MKEGARNSALTVHAARVITVMLAFAALSPTAQADVKPGDKIGVNDAAKIADLISPGLEWCVRHGLPMEIVETRPIGWPAEYKEATEKYSGQVRLSKDGLNLENYVAGLPFTNLDPNDPNLAVKIMWNFEHKPAVTDDLDLRNFDADTGSIETNKPMTVERHFLLDHLRVLYYNGRLFQEPKPEYKPNPSGFRSSTGMYPILEPFDLKGVGFVGNRFIDPAKQDNQWLYLPSLRRVRRMSTAQRSDALFGQDTDVDSYYGYDGHIAWMTWKFLGEREILGVMHAKNYPVKWAQPADWAFDDVWEKRKVYVIEGVSKLPQYAYSKRIIFIDKEAWVVPYSDIYDRAGELWKVWINDWSYRTKPWEGAAEEYPDERPFQPAIVMMDIQLEHATKAALPSHRYPGEQGWYFNHGEKYGVEPEYFTVQGLVEAGH